MLRISEVMTRDVAIISAQHSAQTAAQLMADMKIGILPVCVDHRLVGMLTDRDIAIQVTAQNLRACDVKVSDIMNTDPRWCLENQTPTEALQEMKTHCIRRLAVLNDRQEVVGVVSLTDLARIEPEKAGEVEEQNKTTHSNVGGSKTQSTP